MKTAPNCPRCGGPVHEPNAWTSAWRCEVHGDVYPLFPAYPPSREGMEALLRTAAVPVWLPWPLPVGWLVTGFAGAGDERVGARACVVALSGPNPVGGPGDLLVVAEEPGVGLGARLAGPRRAGPWPGFRGETAVYDISVRRARVPAVARAGAGPRGVRGRGDGKLAVGGAVAGHARACCSWKR